MPKTSADPFSRAVSMYEDSVRILAMAHDPPTSRVGPADEVARTPWLLPGSRGGRRRGGRGLAAGGRKGTFRELGGPGERGSDQGGVRDAGAAGGRRPAWGHETQT